MSIAEFIKAGNAKLEELIEKYPRQLPVPVVAELLGSSENNIRQAVEDSEIGLSWRKAGKLKRGFCIPTGLFIRWYTKGVY